MSARLTTFHIRLFGKQFALLNALHAHHRRLILPEALASMACEIEINRLNEPVGKQDQYIAAYGGLTCFDFHPDEQVAAAPLQVSDDTLYDLEDNLLLFFTGFAQRRQHSSGPGDP